MGDNNNNNNNNNSHNTQARVQVADLGRRDAANDLDTTVVGADHPDAPIQHMVQHAAVHDLDGDSSPPTPRFMQDDGPWKHFRWVPYPVRRIIRATVKWTRGPSPPVRFRINPLFPRIQHAPIVLRDRFLPRPLHRKLAGLGYFGLWLLTFALVLRHGRSITELPGWGTPASIGCGWTFWERGNACGLNGMDCRPFEGGGYLFRCPANCAGYKLGNPRAVGDQEIVYRSLVVGGPPAGGDGPAIYRGDSFICGAAVHAGIVSDAKGGCGIARLIGTQRAFNSSTRHGLTSVGFDSYFPRSFAFDSVDCNAGDMTWPLLSISVVFTSIFSLFVTSAAVFFFPVFTVLFWTVGMATDAPGYDSVASLFSAEIGRFLPAMFAGWVMYDKMGVRRTLQGLTAQVEKTVLWLGAAWVGALTNHTLDFIPIQRLTARDLEQQPGARGALAAIIVVLAAIAAVQVYFIQQEARLVRLIKFYALVGLGLLVGGVLPGLNLRIHHYILALLLLPGTALQTRPSLVYQGLLVGLFVNGIARWDFDPILQTGLALRGDGPLDSALPVIRAPVIALGDANRTITFSWEQPPGASYDGISVLVNDVERFRSYFDEGVAAEGLSNLTWARVPSLQANEYFRFAWMEGSKRGDYTKAGTWDASGRWTAMPEGPSRLRARDGAEMWRL
ncbi:hypothetical protein BT67DRAFT_127865 [Trichocladium antarcticum]|uniref:LCCL domain-containing protein n=1 Tax=Trichocladium antarcticum TaxID=1450529 RepID=A0AAN6URR8_9PEZI|nr:hypothetical protein BT67DRAFT_127865 [Trichocladium antarcticum]